MERIIQLNITDIKSLISKEFGCNTNSIQVEIHGPETDGPYHSSGSVFFRFAEPIDTTTKNIEEQ